MGLGRNALNLRATRKSLSNGQFLGVSCRRPLINFGFTFALQLVHQACPASLFLTTMTVSSNQGHMEGKIYHYFKFYEVLYTCMCICQSWLYHATRQRIFESVSYFL